MRLQSVPDDLKGVLGPNEEVQFYIKQKIYHPKVDIDSVVITNERIILQHPHSPRLKKDYTDYSYQDVSNVLLDKGILRSTVRCTLRFGGEPLAINDLPNSDAQDAYGLIRDNLARQQASLSVPGSSAPFRQGQNPVAFSTASCRRCGSPLVPRQRFCGNCGVPA